MCNSYLLWETLKVELNFSKVSFGLFDFPEIHLTLRNGWQEHRTVNDHPTN